MVHLMNPEDRSDPMDAKAAYIKVRREDGHGYMRGWGTSVKPAPKRSGSAADYVLHAAVIKANERVVAAAEKRVEEIAAQIQAQAAAQAQVIKDIQDQHKHEMKAVTSRLKDVVENQKLMQSIIERCFSNQMNLMPSFTQPQESQ